MIKFQSASNVFQKSARLLSIPKTVQQYTRTVYLTRKEYHLVESIRNYGEKLYDESKKKKKTVCNATNTKCSDMSRRVQAWN